MRARQGKAYVTGPGDSTPQATAAVFPGELSSRPKLRGDARRPRIQAKHGKGQTLDTEGVLSKRASLEGESSLIKPPTRYKQQDFLREVLKSKLETTTATSRFHSDDQEREASTQASGLDKDV